MKRRNVLRVSAVYLAVVLAWILELTPAGLQFDGGSALPSPSLARTLDEDGAQSFEYYTTATGGDPDAAHAIANMFIAYAGSGEVSQITDELIAAALAAC